MTKFEKLQEKYNKILKEYKTVGEKLNKTKEALEKEKPNVEFVCDCCDYNIRVGDIELIEEAYGGSFNFDRDEWNYTRKEYLVCPECTKVLIIPKDLEMFPYGIQSYVKKVHKWDSDRERAHGRVLELLEPNWTRAAEKEVKEKRKRKVEDARKILKEKH